MDTGLKKLWTRRKSKGNDGRKDSAVSSLRKSPSIEQTHLSNNTSPQSHQVRDSSSIDYGKPRFKPTVTNKIQSTLTGGLPSRPSTSRSQPGTDGSGSLLNAVNRAADAVVRAEQAYQYSAERYTETHVRPKTPRYIDIFSLSSSKNPKSKAGYNEDVAERNLDLARVALESSQVQYVPSSKYQEEVAARNAYSNLPESPITPSSIRQEGLNKGQSPVEKRERSYTGSSHRHSAQQSQARSLSSQPQTIQGLSGLHSRQQSDPSSGPLQAFHPLFTADTDTAGLQLPVASNSRPIMGDDHRSIPVDTSSEVPVRHAARQSGEFQGQKASPTNALNDYQLSALELVRIKSTETFASPRTHDYSGRSPSNLSNPSSVKRAINLPNRTIMDLTGDDPDVFADGSPPSTYSASPVLEHAKVEAMRRVHVPAITEMTARHEEIGPKPGHTTSSSPTEAGQSAAKEVSRPVKPPSPVPVSDRPDLIHLPNPPSFTRNFTPIITIASASPRTSVILDKAPDSTDSMDVQRTSQPVQFSTIETDAKDAAGTGNSSDPLIFNHDNLLEETNSVAERPIPVSEQKTDRVMDARFDNEQNAKIGEERANNLPSRLQSTAEPLPLPQPYIHVSHGSGNLSLVDDASHASGVSARDFANTAAKPTLTSVPEDAELNGNGHIKAPAGAVIEAHPQNGDVQSAHLQGQVHELPVYESTFDEADFAHKQAQARDALVRLQVSLNENFLTETAFVPVGRSDKSSPSKHAYSFSDGKPATPSSIFAQVKQTSPTPANTAFETGRPATSYHNQTTHLRPRRSSPAHGASPKQERVKLGRTHEKREQGGDAELNGPGPSIVNEEPKQPLPLPPPLQLNGHAFHQRLLQQQPIVPPSPGEISLSNFPIPVSSPRQAVQKPFVPEKQEGTIPASQHTSQKPSVEERERILRRQSSQRSQASSTSVFSIPFHMIPDRSSSIRDRSVMEGADE